MKMMFEKYKEFQPGVSFQEMDTQITDKKMATGRSLLSIFNEEFPGVL